MVTTNYHQFKACLSKTIAWCEKRVDPSQPKTCLRSQKLKDIVLAHNQNPEEIWLSSNLIADALESRNIDIMKNKPMDLQGSILLCAYEYTNHNGVTQYETNGFFDAHDCPPWDTWICEIECTLGSSQGVDFGESWPPNVRILGSGRHPTCSILAAWIPAQFIHLVQRAIEAEAMGMIFWADSDYPERAIVPRYNEVIPAWFQSAYAK